MWATWLHSTFHSLRPYFSKIHLNIILTSTPKYSSIPNVSSLQVSEINFILILWLSSSHTSHPHIFIKLIICIWLRVTLMKYWVIKDTERISTASHYLHHIMKIRRFSCTFSLPVTWFIYRFKADWNAVFIHDSQLQAESIQTEVCILVLEILSCKIQWLQWQELMYSLVAFSLHYKICNLFCFVMKV